MKNKDKSRELVKIGIKKHLLGVSLKEVSVIYDQYFIDYNFSTISNLNSNLNINIGDNFNVKNSRHNTIDMNYFEVIS